MRPAAANRTAHATKTLARTSMHASSNAVSAQLAAPTVFPPRPTEIESEAQKQ